ncbi:MAG: carboxylesterase family protein, partial [Parasporobacterium sp.]|nr:carboxylesterase family protein [Parasporobacterium sp.]
MVVQTVYGKVEGIQTGGCNVYYGIPFAKPPVLDLTFRHPLPPDPWEGTLAADKGSKNPIQPPTKYGMKNNSLDCLYLNVFVPEGLTKPAPVMVWIYGGSYYEGGAGTNTEGSTELVYDMSYFAKETGCIVVTFNYRLNVYGFLNLHFLDDKFDQNNGLYDQIMALKFVNENIAAFGGDPQNVTVFGQSAGAACILALMTMPEASGLYQKTIVQSPCAEHFFTEEESEKNTKKFLLFAGVKSPEELLYLPENELLSAAKRYYEWTLARGEIRCAFSPTIDGVTLKECPKDAVKASKVPMMIGSVTEEGNLFINPIPTILLPVLQAYLKLPPRKS